MARILRIWPKYDLKKLPQASFEIIWDENNSIMSSASVELTDENMETTMRFLDRCSGSFALKVDMSIFPESDCLADEQSQSENT